MKKFIVFALVSLASAVFADSWTIEVGTASTVIAPTANSSSYKYDDWGSATAYSAGDYVVHDGIPYWTPNGGTSGTDTYLVTNGWNMAHTVPNTTEKYVDAPTHQVGIIESSDGVIWKRVSDNGRRAVILYADPDVPVFFDIAKTCTLNSGGKLEGDGNLRQTLPTNNEVMSRVQGDSGIATIRVVEL